MEVALTPGGRQTWRRKTYPAPLSTGSTLRWLEKDFICGICDRRHDDGNLSRGENQAGFCDDDKPWATVALQPEHYTTVSPERVALYAKIKRIRETLERGTGSIVEGPAMPFWALALKFAERYPAADPLARGAAETSEVKHLLLFFESKPIGDFQLESAEEFATYFLNGSNRRGPRTPASATPLRDMLRRMFGFAFAQGWVAKNPFPKGVRPGPAPPTYSSDRIMMAAEEQRLHAACLDSFSYLLPILLFVADVPAHMRDFLRLRWRDVDLSAGVATVCAFNSKQRVTRAVQMTPRLRAALAALAGRPKPTPDSPLVAYSVDRCNYDFEKVRVSAGVDGLTWTDVRRTGAWRLERAGKDARDIAARAGITLRNIDELLRVNADAAEREARSPLLLKLLAEQFGSQTQAQNGNDNKSAEAPKRDGKLEAERVEFEKIVGSLLDVLPQNKVTRARIAQEYDVCRKTSEPLHPSTITHLVKRCYGEGTAVGDAVEIVAQKRRATAS
ncbi:MAG TPA: hypothetical protein VGP08_02380 [Pyrinomonadaceae bacterium]|jgi:integrase|nr:hypothetical protein [Pyrinomonadaceae bacterium]